MLGNKASPAGSVKLASPLRALPPGHSGEVALSHFSGFAMPGLLPNVDPDGLLEFSVVYTDRSLNHMSKAFMGVINDISSILK